MNLNTEQLKHVEEAAYRLIPPAWIAINLEVDELDFNEALRHPGNPIRNAFYTGYLRQLTETREALLKSAKNGSTPAQIEVLKFIKQINAMLTYG